MCGIYGLVLKDRKGQEKNLKKIDQILETRGPNGVGTIRNENYLLHHRRLSIRDISSNGAQPMVSKSGRYLISYNGEFYNSDKCRNFIEINNIKLRGTSDTEVLLELLEIMGIEKTLEKINGMFAFAALDKKTQNIYIARDRIGIKPLYYHYLPRKSFIFSSDLKAISHSEHFAENISNEGLNKFIRNGFIKGPTSIYENTFKLQPGHYIKLCLKTLNFKVNKYWSLIDHYKAPSIDLSFDQAKQELKNILQNSIKLRMIADVPLGVFLSGGIDSSLITALMQEQSSSPVKTFTIGFNDKTFNEAVYAKDIAKHLKTDHTELYLSDQDTLDVVEKLPLIYTEPFADSSQIPTFIVSQLARKDVTVSLAGDGGDELFLGYNRYLFVSSLYKKIHSAPPSLKALISTSILLFSKGFYNKSFQLLKSASLGSINLASPGEKFHKLATLMSSKDLNDFYQRVTSQIQFPESFQRNSSAFIHNVNNLHSSTKSEQEYLAYLDTLEYLVDDILVKTDRASMGTSLEVRVPFLDHNVVEYAQRIPLDYKIKESSGKYILKEILNDYVPQPLTDRPKMGFSIPLDSWIRGALKDLTLETLSYDKLNTQQLLNADNINNLISDHMNNKKDNGYQIWNLLMFQMWLDQERK